MFREKVSRFLNRVTAAITVVLALAGTGSATAASVLTVEVVNDSGNADSNVFLLLTGTAVSVSGGITSLQLPQATGGSITGGPLTNLTQSGTVTSTYTGQQRPLYSFTVDSLTSGRLLVSYGAGITYANNTAPTATNQRVRWDKLEFGYPNSGADLTSIDFFGIPLQFDYLDDNGNVLNTMTYYVSTPTLLQTLYSLSPSTMSAANQKTDLSFGWKPFADPLSTFARVLGPQTIAAASTNGSPAPYPSFQGYLNSLMASALPFTVTGSNGVGAPAPVPNTMTYNYSGTFVSDGAGGYTVTLMGTLVPSPPATNTQPYGLYTDTSGTTTAKQLPANLPVTLHLPAGKFDNNIYSANATSFTVGQSTNPSAPNYLDPSLRNYTKNSVYANIAGDSISGLQCGYINGKYGNIGAAWYSNPPTPFPFGGARTINDGFYNPYAAVFYNLSDAYGFPFSDRGGRPSPYVPLPSNSSTMRITILNDNRLDTPQVTVSNPTNTTLNLSWPAVNNATGYNVTVSPPFPASTTTLPGTKTKYQLAALSPGTAYTISVQATATQNSLPISSYAVQVSGATTGSAQALSGTVPFQVALNWAADGTMPAGTTFLINNSPYTPGGANVTVNGSIGANIFALNVYNSNNNPIYQGSYVVALSGTASAFSIDPTSFFLLTGNPLALTQAGPPGTPPYNTTSLEMVVGTPFAPTATKQAFPVLFP